MGADAVLTIGRVAALTGIPPKTIRYYEAEGIIACPRRTESGYRLYTRSDVQTLHFVGQARKLGFPLRDVGRLLALYRDRNRASRDVRSLALSYLAELDQKIAQMRAVRDTIAVLAERCHGDDRPECPILAGLEGAMLDNSV